MLRFLSRQQPTAAPRAASVPEGVRVYAIGDVHGRLDLLEQLHGLIATDASQQPARHVMLVYLGDYIDRGPASSGVLEALAGRLPDGWSRVLLRGNHEEMLLRFLADPETGQAWRQLGGLETLLAYRVPVSETLGQPGFAALARHLRERMPEHHVQLLERLELSLSIGDYFFCHAGVRPGIPLAQQTARDLLWIRDEFLSSAHDHGQVVVHGHTPVDAPELRRNRINVDTGAYATGKLTCLVLEGATQKFLSTR